MAQSFESCPTRDALEAFQAARLPDDTLCKIADHLSTCEHCEREISSMSDEADFLRDACRDKDLDQLLSDPALSAMQRYFDAMTAGAGALTRTWDDSEPAPIPPVGEQIGKYVIQRHLGAGGMGHVFQVLDPDLGVERALKIMNSGLVATGSGRERFQRETKAMASVRQKHVVQVHAAELDHPTPYIVMEYVSGGSLANHLREYQDDPRAAVTLMIKIARAVHAIHEANFLHRDLKPHNVLMDESGEPKVSDFGLVKYLDQDRHASMSGAEVGTLPYMAPEQTDLIAEDTSRETDVWALGVMLYQLIVGSLPFKAATTGQLRMEICKADPPLHGRKLAAIDARLRAVLRKCMSRQRNDRYATAESLANDLENWLAHRPMVARPERIIRRGLRYALRHPLQTMAVLACAIGAFSYHSFHPDQPLWQIQRQLERGHSVRLIDDRAEPGWHRTVLGEPAVGQDADGTFTIKAWDLALVALVDDPPCAEFQLEALVHHELSDALGEVGLFAFYADDDLPEGHAHRIVRLAFNDIVSLRKPPPAINVTIPNSDLNPVAFGSRFRVVSPDRPPADAIQANHLATRFFLPGNLVEGAKRWRKLRLDVDQVRIRAFFDSRPIGELTMDEVTRAVAKEYRRRNIQLPVDWSSRSALGLYVLRGTACFRDVRISPRRLE